MTSYFWDDVFNDSLNIQCTSINYITFSFALDHFQRNTLIVAFHTRYLNKEERQSNSTVGYGWMWWRVVESFKDRVHLFFEAHSHSRLITPPPLAPHIIACPVPKASLLHDKPHSVLRLNSVTSVSLSCRCLLAFVPSCSRTISLPDCFIFSSFFRHLNEPSGKK